MLFTVNAKKANSEALRNSVTYQVVEQPPPNVLMGPCGILLRVNESINALPKLVITRIGSLFLIAPYPPVRVGRA